MLNLSEWEDFPDVPDTANTRQSNNRMYAHLWLVIAFPRPAAKNKRAGRVEMLYSCPTKMRHLQLCACCKVPVLDNHLYSILSILPDSIFHIPSLTPLVFSSSITFSFLIVIRLRHTINANAISVETPFTRECWSLVWKLFLGKTNLNLVETTSFSGLSQIIIFPPQYFSF